MYRRLKGQECPFERGDNSDVTFVGLFGAVKDSKKMHLNEKEFCVQNNSIVVFTKYKQLKY